MAGDREWGKRRPVTPEKRLRVIHYLVDYPEMSFSAIAARENVCFSTVCKINREEKCRTAKNAQRPQKDTT